MHTRIDPAILATERGQRAEEILRACVHCGFCNATCPTYQVRGDELDGPRGRIYLVKGMLESGKANATVREHLDRCLTCRACETTCPSGVRYGELAEIGRDMLEEQAPKPSWTSRFLLNVVPRPRLLGALVALGRPLRALLPSRHRRLLQPPPKLADLPAAPDEGAGDVLLLRGCVQRVVTPEVHAHLARLLSARGMKPYAADEHCCGGLALHLGHAARAEAAMRRNVQASRQGNPQTVVSSASGCGVTLKDYGRLLGTDEARTFAAKVRDAAEVLAPFEFRKRPIAGRALRRIAWHPPCTLQHGQRVNGIVERILAATGYELLPVADSHLCCGSAGSYSLLQPQLANELKRRKAQALGQHAPEAIVTANIGCQTHLADAMDVPVLHWLELLE